MIGPLSGRRLAGTCCGLMAALFWSITAPVVASAEGVDPFLYIAILHGAGALIFLPKWLYQRRNPLAELRQVPFWFFCAGLGGIGIHELTWVMALQQAPPLEATLIIYLWPLLVVIFTALALRQRLGWHHALGGLLGFGGIALMLAGRGLDFAGFSLMPGHFYALLCALSWSIFSAIAARQAGLSNNILSLIFLTSAACNALYWFFALDAPPAPTSSLLIVASSAVPLMTAYLLWDFGMKHGDAQLIGIAAFLTPVLAALWLVLLGKSVLTPALIAAFLCVMLGIAAVRYGPLLKSP